MTTTTGAYAMGLAGVEMLMAVEDRFGIAITDREAAELVTVDDLYRLVVEKLVALREEACLSSHIFYRARRALMTALDVPREAVRLETPLDTLVPRQARQRHWRDFSRALGLETPPLAPPRPLYWGIIATATLVAIGMTAYLLVGAAAFWSDFWNALFFGLLTGGVALVALFRLTVPFARQIPRACATMRDLVQTLIADNYGALRREAYQRNEQNVRQALVDTLSQQSRLPRAQITPETNLWSDLCGE